MTTFSNGAENGTWRNFYLTGAFELRGGTTGTPTVTASPDILAQLTLDQIFDSVAIRVDGPRAAALRIGIDWTVTTGDTESAYWSRLSRGALIHGSGTGREQADARIRLSRAALLALCSGAATPDTLAESESTTIDGPADVLTRMFEVLDSPDPGFAIVTP
ncbi:alkyl sulfatase C-terminal domain-containing protein [Amycolatopsis rhabdoformis]|uniref:Alkyl sulfatase C-terminal domain-containing protein n=1 Tax=Amycolatopsis rhabdoformis TaxID=1448059 RepID=A0ABZ1ICS9_9PSEU|nr:alkyl sulfatase C-terminal domain-containing protein [Amycolatopsis rhabdoformis]WSE32265.1 alkyl sulfatase C-terminal domain-containing protein [Amycolatopsis rhabdoformis]